MDGVVTTGVKAGDEYLVFSRGLDDEEMEDRGVYLECRDQINGGYDCIKTCVLRRERLEVELSKPIDPRKDIEGFHVKLALSDEQLRSLAAGLRQVFRDAPVLNGHGVALWCSRTFCSGSSRGIKIVCPKL